MLLSVCGAVACEPGTCDAEEGVLLQAKSLIRKHKQTNTKDANGLLQSLRSVATSLKKGSDVSMSPDEVNAAIGTASSTLDTMFPIMADEHRLAQQSIDDAVRAVEACHDDHGSERTASLEQAVATRYSELEECDESLGQAMRAEVETCEGQEDDPNCLCTEARTAVVDQRALCTSVSTTYEMAYCEFRMLCSTFQGCHEREVAIYNDVRADVEAEMILRQQEYTTAMQAQCLLQLIIGAMTRGTPIPDDPLTACDDVSLDDLTLSFPAAPAEPECPEPPTDAPQCDEIDIVPPLACNWALPGAWQITATSHWDGNYAPDNVKVHGGNPWHTGTANTLPQDLNFDAGQAVTLGGFATAHPTGWAGSAMQAYTLSVSNDGSSFTEVVSGTGNNLGNQERQEIDFPQVSGRYWRLHVTSNHGYGNYVTDQFVELKVCTPCEPFGWVLPSDWSVTASSQWDGNYAASNVKVHGGNPWHTGRSNTLPDNLNFDAGHEVTMSGFATAHPGGWAGSAMNNYAFSKSDDGLHYTEVHSGAGRNLAHGERQEIEFEPATARYWRLYVTSNHGYGNYVTDQYVEFKIQNECSDDGSDRYEDFQYTGGPGGPVFFDQTNSALTATEGALTGAGQLSWNRGSNAARQINQGDGICGISFKCDTAASHLMVGLSHDQVNRWQDVDFGVCCRGAWHPVLDLYESSAHVHRTNDRSNNGNYASDVYAIRINAGGQVEYSINGGVIYTSNRAVTYPWHVGLDVYTSPSLADMEYLSC